MVNEGRPQGHSERVVGGRYRLTGRLGAGGMGAVWAGRDLLVDRDVALKEAYVPESLPTGGRGSGGAAHTERILREARAAARVDHPSVVTVHDVVVEDGIPWIVMERVRGESLEDRLRREGSLSEPETARIALAVAEALRAAHARGVLHRDVKPGNVLLDPATGRVVLTDFGIAYIEGDEPLTRSGEFIGSLEYTAPERMGGSRPGPPSDLWSLGVLLVRMLEGRSPFRRESLEATVTAVVLAELPRLSAPGQLGQLVGELLVRDPEARPSADMVVAALRGVGSAAGKRTGRTASGRAGVAAGPVMPSVHERATADGPLLPQPRLEPVSLLEPLPESSPVPVRPGRWATRRAVRLGVVVMAFLLGGLVAFYPWGSLRGEPESRGPGATSAAPPAGPSAPASTGPGRRGSQEPSTTAEFSVEVPAGWKPLAKNNRGQYRYRGPGGLELTVVPGRDTAAKYGSDPMVYQLKEEQELAPFRDSTWASQSGLRRVGVGKDAMALGTFSWTDGRGRQLYVRNQARLAAGRYHLLLVTGLEQKDNEEADRVFERATATYRPR
ncbi:serine/threonine-protein kinase [Streptomyces sp. NPDC051561]|uniref:serine/threonine-protein kinase n=1 Tax=Streptomyces sp. NPDC051561 TaxID=3365658 RepID=UPI00378ED111